MSELIAQLKPISPVIAVFVGAIAAILAGAFMKRENRSALPYVALSALALALVLLVNFWGGKGYLFHGALKPDAFSSFLGAVILLGAGIATLASVGYAERAGIGHGEYYGLMLTSTGGMMLLV
ncbi:MAG: hypothetical protein ACYS47_20220, partial [Planctomycetota bacterium]